MTAPAIDTLLARLEGVKGAGRRAWTARCPAHDDRSPSLSIREVGDRVLLHCHAGCGFEEIAGEVGMPPAAFFADPGGGGVQGSPSTRAYVHTSSGCSLDRFAAAKKLPADFLRSLGVSDYIDSRFKAPVLRMPYRDQGGGEPAVRLRVNLTKSPDGTDQRFLWKKGSKPCLYGLDRLGLAREQGFAVGVEGESCAQTLWHHNIPAFGIPGATNWKELRDAPCLKGIDRIYMIVEPDKGGEAVLGWLGRSSIRDRAWIIELPEDVSALHLDDPERFEEHFRAAMDAAVPWRVRAAESETAERREVGERCKDLARAPRILDAFAEALRARGIVGEVRLGKLTYLATTSRLLDKIVSVAVKGPSAAGKSFVVERALEFFPPSAFYVLTAMSERGLIFIDADMRHTMLVVYEAQGMEGDMQSYLMRSLLSEGRIRYQTTKKDGGEIVGHLIELEGPTGLIVTTTAITLHPENETRLLSVTATDTPDQTRAIFRALAEERSSQPDTGEWHAIQRYLELGSREVTVPYASELAESIPPVAVRLRRDFGALLGLIRAHALLHQDSRERDGQGWIVATADDYAVVRELVADLVAEGVEQTVKPEVREAVEAVAETGTEEGASRRKIAEALKLDASAAGRRLQAAQRAGYLRNLETSRGRPARWVTADSLPEDVEILPEPASVCTCARDLAVSPDPLPPSSNGTEPATPAQEAEGERIAEKLGGLE